MSMHKTVEHRFPASKAVDWIRYHLQVNQLDVCFTSGSVYRYMDVPPGVVDDFIGSPSAGKFLHRHIAPRFRTDLIVSPLSDPPVNADARISKFSDQSFKDILTHIPASWHSLIQPILQSAPMLIKAVRNRKTRHGDHRCRGHSEITVNITGNEWRFVITLLHEIAHAQVAHRIHRRVLPHGLEWKSAFRFLLLETLPSFPLSLQRPLADYSRDPLYSSDSHPSLQKALRAYDTLDTRLTLQEVPLGTMFCLENRTILKKGQLLRSRYRCNHSSGKVFLVPAAARIEVVRESAAQIEQ